MKIEISDAFAAELEADRQRRRYPSTVDEAVEQLVLLYLQSLAEGSRGTDPLTKCRTRHALKNEVNRSFWSGENAVSTVRETFLCIDIEHLNRINDIEGMRAGNARLVEVAERLRERFGEADVFRWGGDELVVALRGKEAGVPEVLPLILKHALVEVDVPRNSHVSSHLTDWVLLHLDAGCMAATAAGTVIHCDTPEWMCDLERSKRS